MLNIACFNSHMSTYRVAENEEVFDLPKVGAEALIGTESFCGKGILTIQPRII